MTLQKKYSDFRNKSNNIRKLRHFSFISFFISVFLTVLILKVPFFQRKPYLTVMMLLLFILKGFTDIYPTQLLYIICGVIFEFPTALAVSFFGLILSSASSYLVGFHLKDSIDPYLKAEYKSTGILSSMKDCSDLFKCFASKNEFLRPEHIVSIFLSSSGTGFRHYITGTVCGSSPDILTAVLLGYAVKFSFSDELAVMVLLRLLSHIYYYYLYKEFSAEH